ncbi:hypothetical protein LTR29_010316 [Friedmanniomyces endolithicus]|nr:hypothetical protein LTR29_010316 [Friedmanniomyces endolithicus]
MAAQVPLPSPLVVAERTEEVAGAGESEERSAKIHLAVAGEEAIAGALDKDGDEDMVSLGQGEEDDDEEARAELELARIEAKLKLDNIRRKKKRLAADGGGGGGADDGGESGGRASSRRADSRPTSPRKPLGTVELQPKLRYQTDVEVPHSPLRHRPLPTEHVSPARKRLGLHAPAKAVDVSLKRARDGTQVMQPTSSAQPDAPRGKSFNERLRATVERADDREAKYERIESSRSKGFGAISTNLGEMRRRLKEGSPEPTRTARSEPERPSSAWGQQISSATTTKEPSISRSASMRSTQSRSQPRPTANSVFRQPGDRRTSEPEPEPSIPALESDDDETNDFNDNQHPSSYDPFSSLHLTKRHIAHPTLTRALARKQIYTLPRLLKEVKSPHYDPPDCDTDYVLFALLASKSTPYDQKAKHRTTDENQPQDDAPGTRNKFMVLKLTDLTWEIDLFLFGTAFTQFWKLTPGTLLAILNPDILPPTQAQQHSGKFSLKLGSSEDSVMEIGVGRDLLWCSSVRKDGRECGEWVDKRKTDICGFHLDLFVERQRKGRMEVNGMWRGRGTGEEGGKGGRAAGLRQGSPKRRQNGVVQSREYGTLYSVHTGNFSGQKGGPSTASLLDAEDTDRLASWTEAEKSRQRIAASQKERHLQRQLNKLASEGNDSVGAQYMRATAKPSTNLTAEDQAASADAAQGSKLYFEKPSAASLGLLGKVAGEVRMSPLKDRKRHFGSGAVSKTGGREAVGWGGAGRALDRGLGVGGSAGAGAGGVGGALEKGQKTLGGALSGAGATPGGTAGLGITTADPAGTLARPTAMRARSQDGSLSPAKKRARFMLAGKGFREPGGRESGGVEIGQKDHGAHYEDNEDKDDDDDEGLEIV